jgi:uncharacterized protein (DUF1499 family)
MQSIHNNKLFPCPNSPNGVCSDSGERQRSIEPFRSDQHQSRESLGSILKKLSPHYLVRRLSSRLKITCIRSER